MKVSSARKSIGLTAFTENMSSFAPQPVFTHYYFEIVQDRRGYWLAKEREGLIGGVFRTQKDALRFALFEVAGDSSCVRVFPGDGSPDNRRVAGRENDRYRGSVGAGDPVIPRAAKEPRRRAH